jgi:hypothetical protein
VNGKDCSICVYHDGIRADGTVRCCTPDRQHDMTAVDCCIPAKPLRELQARTRTAVDFITVTQSYIVDVKNKSRYWLKNERRMAEK